jgi:hypothetical protein
MAGQAVRADREPKLIAENAVKPQPKARGIYSASGQCVQTHFEAPAAGEAE